MDTMIFLLNSDSQTLFLTNLNREDIQGRNDGHSFRPGIHVHIMRGRVLEDGLNHLNKLGNNLRRRLIVQYVNAAGATEAGEFIPYTCIILFDPTFD